MFSVFARGCRRSDGLRGACGVLAAALPGNIQRLDEKKTINGSAGLSSISSFVNGPWASTAGNGAGRNLTERHNPIRFPQGIPTAGPKMIVRQRKLQLSLFVALVFAFPTAAFAQLYPSLCSSNAQCPDGFICKTGFLGLKWCLFDFCNTDSDCTRPGDLCLNGQCQRPPRPPPPAPFSPAPSGLPGEGARCGPQNVGGVIKNFGCRQRLRCNVFGFCERLPS